MIDDLRHVELGGVGGDVQRLGDLPVAQCERHLLELLAFAGRQQFALAREAPPWAGQISASFPV